MPQEISTYRRAWPRRWFDILNLPTEWDFGPEDIRVEEYRENGSYVVRAEAPGIDPEKDVDLTVQNGHLFLQIDRHKESKLEDKDYIREEIRYGRFQRSLDLPAGSTEKDIKATYHNGILEVRFPAGEHKSHKIPVSVN